MHLSCSPAATCHCVAQEPIHGNGVQRFVMQATRLDPYRLTAYYPRLIGLTRATSLFSPFFSCMTSLPSSGVAPFRSFHSGTAPGVCASRLFPAGWNYLTYQEDRQKSPPGYTQDLDFPWVSRPNRREEPNCLEAETVLGQLRIVCHGKPEWAEEPSSFRCSMDF